jgi:hypothetical protein
VTDLAIPAVGRNSQCPCGSGKRYKECHGAIGSSNVASPSATALQARRSSYRAPDTEWVHLSDMERDDLGAAMEAALGHQTANRPEEARSLYERVLARAPDTHDALHMLGVIELGFRNLERADQLIGAASKLRPPYPAIEANIKLLRETMIDRTRATEDQLSERALPVFCDLLRESGSLGAPAEALHGTGALHLIGRMLGEDEDDVWLLRRLREVLAARQPTVWAADGDAFQPADGRTEVVDAPGGHYPRDGTHVFIGLDHDFGSWIGRSRPDRLIVVCGSGRPSHWITQLRRLTMDGARRLELAFVSPAYAERFSDGHAIVPLPLEPPVVSDAPEPAAREMDVWSIEERRPWSVGMIGGINDAIDEPKDHPRIGEIAAHAGRMAIYDPGRLRFQLGANDDIRFVSKSSGGLAAFLAGVDCLYCRARPWWDEGMGREVMTAMALAKPVLCPRRSIHAWQIDDGVDGLLYDTHDQALKLVQNLARAPQWAQQLGEAAREKSRQRIDAAQRNASYRAILPLTHVATGEPL